MSILKHVELIYCFQYSQDPKVRLIIGNLACGLYDVDLWVSNGLLCNESFKISLSEDPERLTDFISKTVGELSEDESKRSKGSKQALARAFVLRESNRLELSKSEMLQAYNTLTFFISTRKISLLDFRVDGGVDGVSFDKGTLVFSK